MARAGGNCRPPTEPEESLFVATRRGDGGQVGQGLEDKPQPLAAARHQAENLATVAAWPSTTLWTRGCSKTWRFDVEELRRLYVEEEWASPRIAQHLGVSEATVLRVLHRHHLPVAVRGGRGGKRVRFDELVADRRVGAALERAGVALAGKDAPVLRRPLPAPLLRTLLVDLDLSTFDVELLTGRPVRQVRADAAGHGIEASAMPAGVSADDLRRAYLDDGWSLKRMCAEFGIAGRVTLLSLLSEHGMPPRTERANPWLARRQSSA